MILYVNSGLWPLFVIEWVLSLLLINTVFNHLLYLSIRPVNAQLDIL